MEGLRRWRDLKQFSVEVEEKAVDEGEGDDDIIIFRKFKPVAGMETVYASAEEVKEEVTSGSFRDSPPNRRKLRSLSRLTGERRADKCGRLRPAMIWLKEAMRTLASIRKRMKQLTRTLQSEFRLFRGPQRLLHLCVQLSLQFGAGRFSSARK